MNLAVCIQKPNWTIPQCLVTEKDRGIVEKREEDNGLWSCTATAV